MLSISPPDGAADEDDEENGLLKVMLDDDEDVKGIYLLRYMNYHKVLNINNTVIFPW